MNHRAPRLATVLILALAMRAGAQPLDPYAGHYQPPAHPPGAYSQPGYAPPAASPPGNPQADRYPLPQPGQIPQGPAPQAYAPHAAAGGQSLASPGSHPFGTAVQSYAAPVVQRPVHHLPQAGAVTADLFQPAQIIARVGDKHILYGDVAPTVNQILEPMLAKAKSDFERQQIEEAREMLVKNVLRQLVESKLMYLQFERELFRNAEGDADKLAGARREIDKQVADIFEKKLAHYREKVAEAEPAQLQTLLRSDPIVVRLAILMKDNQAETPGDLDLLLRRHGSSLAFQVRQFGEHELGMEMMKRSIRSNPDVTHQEMLDYYREHTEDYYLPAKAKFEILTVKFSSFRDRNEAWNAICAMGNEVYYGKPFAAVARQSSQDPQAPSGGQYDWTTRGSLASKPIDHAVFTLEPGKLSQVIEDERGFHIVRVIERQAEGMVSFLEAQPKIKESIKTKKREEDYKKFLAGLRDHTQVWTVYDDAAVAQQGGPTMQR